MAKGNRKRISIHSNSSDPNPGPISLEGSDWTPAKPEVKPLLHPQPAPPVRVVKQYAAKYDLNLLVTLPDEILEQILVNFSLDDINNVMEVVDVHTQVAIRRNIYTPTGPHDVRGTQIMAHLAQDDNLYKAGLTATVRTTLLSQLRESVSQVVSTIFIEGSTCLLAKDLELLSYRPSEKKSTGLQSVEIKHSFMFSPLRLLHHAGRDSKTFGPIVFSLTGFHTRWCIPFKYQQSLQLCIAFLYAYGAKLWRHFPTVFVESKGDGNNEFGQWLNNNTYGVFFDQSRWRVIKRSKATKHVPTVDDYYSDFDEDVPNHDRVWRKLSDEQLKFAYDIAARISPELLDHPYREYDFPCEECNQRMPFFCFQHTQFTKLTAGSGMCILCAYDRFEEDQDNTFLGYYQDDNPKIRSPGSHTWPMGALARRQQVIPRTILQFSGVVADDEWAVDPAAAPAQEPSFDEELCQGYDCKDEETQLDKKEMAEGLCRPCQTKLARGRDQMQNPTALSFKKIGEQNRREAAAAAALKGRKLVGQTTPSAIWPEPEKEETEQISELAAGFSALAVLPTTAVLPETTSVPSAVPSVDSASEWEFADLQDPAATELDMAQGDQDYYENLWITTPGEVADEVEVADESEVKEVMPQSQVHESDSGGPTSFSSADDDTMVSNSREDSESGNESGSPSTGLSSAEEDVVVITAGKDEKPMDEATEKLWKTCTDLDNNTEINTHHCQVKLSVNDSNSQVSVNINVNSQMPVVFNIKVNQDTPTTSSEGPKKKSDHPFDAICNNFFTHYFRSTQKYMQGEEIDCCEKCKKHVPKMFENFVRK